jgi:hypothetical protein
MRRQPGLSVGFPISSSKQMQWKKQECGRFT